MSKNYNIHLKGYVGGWNFSSDMVAYILDKRAGQEVSVLIDSLGGRVDHALSISSMFKNHGNVHCHYVGMNASAATIASMGAKRVTMDAAALFLVHKCMAIADEWGYMNADEIADAIARLEKTKKDNETIDTVIASLYASRCKKSKDELLALMKEGAWLTAQQALEWGFVDELTDQPEDAAPVITDTVADALAQQGIPLPELEAKRGSFMERLFQFFTGSHIQKPAAVAAITPNEMPENKFTALAALIGEAVAVEADGGVALTQEHAEKIEASLTEQSAAIEAHAAAIAEKEAKIAELEARVAALAAEPAATTSTVVEESKEGTSLANLDKKKLADALLKNIP